jgi:hypothetical protein
MPIFVGEGRYQFVYSVNNTVNNWKPVFTVKSPGAIDRGRSPGAAARQRLGCGGPRRIVAAPDAGRPSRRRSGAAEKRKHASRRRTCKAAPTG